MQKVTIKITRAGRPCTGIAAFFYPVLAYIKQARFACGETPVTGTTCTQRLLFHTTIYITKHLHACQGKTGSRRIFFVHMADFMPQKNPVHLHTPGLILHHYSRYILRRRIRRAGVRPYSRARYSSALPHASRMTCST